VRPRPAGDALAGDAREIVGRLAAQAAPADDTIPALPPAEGKAMQAVFARMKSIYGHLWSSNFRDERQLRIAQIDWLRAFRAAGVTTGHVNRALDWCAQHQADMPNLPRLVAIAKAQRYAAQREAEREAGVALLPETPEQAAAREAKAREEREARRDGNLAEIAKIKALLGT